MVNEHDWRLDPIMLKDFCKLLDITDEYFWKAVDKFANPDLIEKKEGIWRLKEPLS